MTSQTVIKLYTGECYLLWWYMTRETQTQGVAIVLTFLDKPLCCKHYSLATLMNCLMSFALVSDLVSLTTAVTTQYISSLGICGYYSIITSYLTVHTIPAHTCRCMHTQTHTHTSWLTFSNFARFCLAIWLGFLHRSAMYSRASMLLNTSESWAQGHVCIAMSE